MGAIKLENENKQIYEILIKSELFRNLSSDQFDQLISKMDRVDIKQGTPLFLEQESSEHVYFLLDGCVRIEKYSTRLKRSQEIRKIYSGEHFSEFSVLTGSNHSTTCVAEQNSKLFKLDRKSFWEALRSSPLVAKGLVLFIAKLTRQFVSRNNYVEYFKKESFEVTTELIQTIPQKLMTQFDCVPLSLKNKTLRVAMKNPYDQKFFETMELQFPDLEVVTDLINDEDLKEMTQALAFHYTGDEHVLKKGERGKGTGIRGYSEPESLTLIDLLKTDDIFSQLDEQIIQMLTPYFEFKVVDKGEVIFEKDEPSKHFYIIQRGKVAFFKDLGSGGVSKAFSLGAKDSFSAISLLTNSNHSLRAVAEKDTSLFLLDKESFDELLKSVDFCIELAKVLVRRLQVMNSETRIHFFDEDEMDLSLLRAHILPVPLMIQNKILPVKQEDQVLTLAVSNFENPNLYYVCNRYLSHFNIKIVYLPEKVLEKYSQQVQPQDFSERGKLKVLSGASKKVSLDEILEEALKMRASDIHFEPDKKELVIRFRIDGVIHEVDARVPVREGLELINRIKIKSKMDISENRLPQEGQLSLTVDSMPLQARASIVPTRYGEKLVLRLIPLEKPIIPVESLVPDKHAVQFINEMTRRKQGLFIISGPTGSGKTTTLYSMISVLNRVSCNITTIEDPIERSIPGTTQIEVNEDVDLSYGKILKYILRQDPDVIFIGEIRDEESANYAIDAALTGHLVLTTIHSNDSIEIIHKLNRFGIPHHSLSTALVGSLAQRLVPAICSHCKYDRPTTPYEKNVFEFFQPGSTPPEQLSQGSGCSHCHETGYFDRVPVLEYWQKNSDVSPVLAKEDRSHEEFMESLQGQGYRTLVQFGLSMVRQGITTVDVVERFLPGFIHNFKK